jgi:hypothetical protein
MVHTTDKEPLNEKRYYWRVDASYVIFHFFFSKFFLYIYIDV